MMLQQTIAKEFMLRPLQEDDYQKGYKECLGNLTIVDGLTSTVFDGKLNQFTNFKLSLDVLSEMKKLPEIYLVLVIEDTSNNSIAATGTVVVERKFIRGGGKVYNAGLCF